MNEPEINPHLYVKAKFTEKDGTVFEAVSVDRVVQRVTAYRQRLNQPVGDVRNDVVTQICNKTPHLCVWPVKAPQPKAKPQASGELNKRILDWVTGIADRYLRGKLRFFRDREEIIRRVKICSACPRSKTWASSCAACRAEVARLEREVKAPLGPLRIRVDDAEKLNGCAVLGEDPRLSVFLNEQKIDSENLPGGCWRKA